MEMNDFSVNTEKYKQIFLLDEIFTYEVRISCIFYEKLIENISK